MSVACLELKSTIRHASSKTISLNIAVVGWYHGVVLSPIIIEPDHHVPSYFDFVYSAQLVLPDSSYVHTKKEHTQPHNQVKKKIAFHSHASFRGFHKPLHVYEPQSVFGFQAKLTNTSASNF